MSVSKHTNISRCQPVYRVLLNSEPVGEDLDPGEFGWDEIADFDTLSEATAWAEWARSSDENKRKAIMVVTLWDVLEEKAAAAEAQRDAQTMQTQWPASMFFGWDAADCTGSCHCRTMCDCAEHGAKLCDSESCAAAREREYADYQQGMAEGLGE